MSPGWLLVVIMAAVGLPAGAGVFVLWIAPSWEPLDDDVVSHRLARGATSLSVRNRLELWLRRKPRQLTYGRDKRGRFRRVRRG